MAKWLVVVCAIWGMASAALAQESAAPASAAATSSAPLAPATSSAPLPAAPQPKFVYGSRDDYRFQVAFSYAYVRFRSTPFDASAHGVNTSLSYYLNEWLGLEGGVTAAFGPTVLASGRAKYLFYGGGPRVTYRRGRWEPWLHAVVGGVHLQPQIANSARNSFAWEAGGGVDWRWRPHWAVRLGGDWVRSNLYSQSQNNAQITAGFVFRF